MYIMFIHVCTHMYMAISYIFKYECVRTYVYMCVYVCTYIDVCVYITGLGRGQAHHAAQGTEQRPPRHDRYHRVCVSVCLCVCFSLSLSACRSLCVSVCLTACWCVCARICVGVCYTDTHHGACVNMYAGTLSTRPPRRSPSSTPARNWRKLKHVSQVQILAASSFVASFLMCHGVQRAVARRKALWPSLYALIFDPCLKALSS